MNNEYNLQYASKNFGKLFNLAIKDRIPIKIRKKKGDSVYIIPEDDFNSIEETFYLLKNPINAKHLLNALDEDSHKFNSIEELKNEVGV